MIGVTARRCLLGLTIGLIGAATVVADQPWLVLRSHRELLQAPLSAAESGTYRLWAWAEKGKPIRLSVGGKLSIRRQPLSAREIALWLTERRHAQTQVH